jgi:hypothetical protein
MNLVQQPCHVPRKSRRMTVSAFLREKEDRDNQQGTYYEHLEVTHIYEALLTTWAPNESFNTTINDPPNSADHSQETRKIRPEEFSICDTETSP